MIKFNVRIPRTTGLTHDFMKAGGKGVIDNF